MDMHWPTALRWALVTLISLLHLVDCQQRQPNIVFILADDYGWNDVGYHGSEIHTPTLDKLAATGVKLENYYVQPICTPTRSQLLSGRYQIHTGLQHGIIWPSQANGLPLSVPTVADKLREAGYATHAVGKWHLGFYKADYTPLRRGFDSHYGFWSGGEDHLTHVNCDDLNKQICGLDLRNGSQPDANQVGHYSTQLFTTEAQRVINKHVREHAKKPLFLYLPYQAVHSPLQIAERYMRPYQHIKDVSRRRYAGMVACLDEAVANITSTLVESGLWNNTILIFSTDNGGQVHSGGNNWPLRGWKGSLWEGGMRGVAFVHSPLLLRKRGTVSRGLMHVSDWFPTLVHLANGNTKGLQLDGYNIWPAINEGLPSPRKELLHNIDPMVASGGKSPEESSFDTRIRAAIRVGPWKLITGNPGPSSWVPPPHLSDRRAASDARDSSVASETRHLWLFNVNEDPTEHHDVSAAQPDVVRRLLRRLAAYNATAVPVRFPPRDPMADPNLHGGVWSSWEDDERPIPYRWDAARYDGDFPLIDVL